MISRVFTFSAIANLILFMDIVYAQNISDRKCAATQESYQEAGSGCFDRDSPMCRASARYLLDCGVDPRDLGPIQSARMEIYLEQRCKSAETTYKSGYCIKFPDSQDCSYAVKMLGECGIDPNSLNARPVANAQECEKYKDIYLTNCKTSRAGRSCSKVASFLEGCGMDLQGLDSSGSVQPPRYSSSVFEQLNPAEQKEIVDEANTQRQACERQTNFAKWHNCDCLTERFKAERLSSGPSAAASNIWDSIEKECVDATAIQAETYNICMENGDDDFENFCQCISEKTVAKYEENPYPNSRYIGDITVEAHQECRHHKS